MAWGSRISLTPSGREKEARRLAHLFLRELSATTQDFAPSGHEGWYSDYALGFAAAHVGLAAQLVQMRYALAWFTRWPREEHMPPLTADLIPAQLGLDRDRFVAAAAHADEAYKTSDAYHPLNLGVGTGHAVLRGSLARLQAPVGRTYFGVRIMKLDTELRKLCAPTRFGRITGYRPARLAYGYLVRRTLGETVFGVTTKQADQYALTYRPTPDRTEADAKPS